MVRILIIEFHCLAFGESAAGTVEKTDTIIQTFVYANTRYCCNVLWNLNFAPNLFGCFVNTFDQMWTHLITFTGKLLLEDAWLLLSIRATGSLCGLKHKRGICSCHPRCFYLCVFGRVEGIIDGVQLKGEVNILEPYHKAEFNPAELPWWGVFQDEWKHCPRTRLHLFSTVFRQ